MRFLTQLDSVSTPEYLPFNNFRFWSETGRLKMIWPIKPDSLDDLQRYLGHLAAASHWQRRVQETSHMVTQPPETNSPDSEAATQIASQPLEQNELGYRGDLEEQLAKMCMIDRATLIDDLEAGDQVTAKTVIQLMYQAGYLAPISKDQMAIPSKGVLDDIEGFYKHMMQTHSVRF
ncbi:hypothetical protein H4R19_002912 [Coemansia spiralis]|nr:hypothetical protein H4R19_002912 [Coemansia spiralis]